MERSSIDQDWSAKYEQCLHASEKLSTIEMGSNSKFFTYWFIKEKDAQVWGIAKHDAQYQLCSYIYHIMIALWLWVPVSILNLIGSHI